MKQKSQRTLAPKLRFPEFRETDAWSLRKLSDFLVERKQRNRQLKYDKQDVLSVSGEHGCVNQIELLGRSYAGVSVKEYHIVETGDIVYTKSPLKLNPYGIIKENKGKPGIVSTLYAVYHTTAEGHPAYFDHYFSRDYNLNSYLQPIVRKGAKNDMKVNNYAVLGGEIFVPKLKEQQKIAECLSSLDGLIAAEGRALEALRDHKRGLMQQLFPQPGQTQPRLRFPEFRDKGEWTREKLGRICKFVRGPFGGALKKEIFVPAGYAVYEQSHAIHKDLDTFRYYIDEIKYNELKRFAVKPNDIIMSCSGTMGKFAVLSSKPTLGVINQALLKLSVDNKYDLGFIAIALELPGNQSRLLAQSAGGAIKNVVGVKLLKEIEINVPAKQEQSRIADCLTALDDRIAAQVAKIETLRQHKRGLIQQLFPSPQEVET